MHLLVIFVVGLKRLIGIRDIFDPHALANLDPEIIIGEILVMGGGAPDKLIVEIDRHKDEGGEDVEKIFIGDGPAAMQLIHAAERSASPFAVIAVLGNFRDDERGIVITLL